MGESVYKVVELVGTSAESWEKAAGAAVARAGKTLRDLRVAGDLATRHAAGRRQGRSLPGQGQTLLQV